MINEEFIKRKISLIQDELVVLKQLADFSLEEIASDSMKQAAMEHILERIVNRAIDVNQHIIKEMATKEISPPKDYMETFLALSVLGVYPEKFAKSIAKSVGTRNKLAHDYDDVDQALIYSSMKDCLNDYRQYGEYILEFLEKNKT